MNNEQLKKTAVQVRELIADPDHWTRDFCAVDKDGNRALIFGSEAVGWCLMGAIAKVCDNRDLILTDFEKYLYSKIASISTFNDLHSHEEILSFLDEVIEEL
jgi:hypothetical protein